MGDVREEETGSCAEWMSQLPEELWGIPLWNLAIPGSHDAMTYCLDLHSAMLKSEPTAVRVLDCIMPCVIRPCVRKWATTQEWFISDQLDAGVRFLDLRIAHKKSDADDVFYFAHAIYSRPTVKEALTDAAQWLEQHLKEVVILALSHFDGLNSDRHMELIYFLESLFGKKLCPNTEKPSLQTCWDRGYQVILSYDHDTAAAGHKELWPKVDYWWADKTDPRLVISYLENRKETVGRPDRFFVAGLNLTEDYKYVILHPCQSMKTMTFRAYSLLLAWVREQHPGADTTCLNIICGDYVGLNEFAKLVIALNQKLLKGETQ